MRMMRGLALLAVFSCSAVSAETPAELQAAEAGVYGAWEKVPLTARIAALVQETSTGFGMYKTRMSDTYKAGEPIILYIEPIGYGWKALDNEMFEISFVADLAIKDESGSVLMEKKEFLNTSQQTHNRNLEYSIDLTLTLNEAPAGRYIVEYVIRDVNSGENATVEKAIEITG